MAKHRSLRDKHPELIKVQFRMRALQQFRKVMELEGRTIDTELISIADLNKAHEVEAFLERIFGYRFHILMAAKEAIIKEGGEINGPNKERAPISRGVHERRRRRR